MRDRRPPPPPPRGGGHRPMPLTPSLWTPHNNNTSDVQQQDDEETATAAAAATDNDSYLVAANGGRLDDSLRQDDDDENDDDDDDDEEYSPLPVAVLGGIKAKESPSPFPMVWNDDDDHGHAVAVTTPGRGGGNREGLHHRHVSVVSATATAVAPDATTIAIAASAAGETVALHVVHSPNTATATATATAAGPTTSPLRQRRLVGDASPYRFQQNHHHHHAGGSPGGVMLTTSSLYKHQQQQAHGWWKKPPACLQLLFKTKSRRNGIISLGLLFYFGGLWQMHQQASSSISASTVSYLDDAMRSTTRRPYDFLKSLQSSNQYYYWSNSRGRGGANDRVEDDNLLQPWQKAKEDDKLVVVANQHQQPERLKAQERIQARRLERQARTRPPLNSNTVLLQPPPPPQQQQQPQRAIVPQPPPLHVVASVQDLCGIHAQRAFSSSTQSSSAFYGLRDALSRNRTSSMSSDRKSPNDKKNRTLYDDIEIRVVMTGNALSHPMGWLLALQLQQTCGVHVVVMVDPMQPATRMHRLQHYAQRLMLLQNRIPELRVLESLIGWQGDLSILDKISEQWKHGYHKKRIPTWPRLMQTTGDVNLVAQWKPTHVVHFAAPPSSSLSSTYNHRDENSESSSWLMLSNAFQIQSSLVSLEQVLASVAATTPQTRRPHVVFATTTSNTGVQNKDDDEMIRHGRSLTDHLADMQVILAMAYHDRYQVQSVHVQLPNAVLGPHSTLEQIFHHSSSSTAAADAAQQFDVVYATDVAQAMIAAMQFRSAQPTTFAIGSTTSDSTTTTATTDDRPSVLFTTPQLKKLHVSLLAASNSTGPLTSRGLAATTTKRNNEEAYTRTSSYLGWSPQTSVEETLLRTHAWSLDYKRQEEQNQWMILPAAAQQAHKNQTGDEFLIHHAINTCAANDWACHASPQFMPCASECSYRDQCTSSGLDGDLASISKESSEGCDIVMYTQLWGSHVKDLDLKSEYMEDGNPLICNYAFVSRDSSLVKSVIDKVPDSELERFGVVTSAQESKASLQEQKLEKLNGRLLYRGWVLLWTTANQPISNTDSSLLKLSPGRFFAEQVKFALFIEPTLPVAPLSRDIRFLVKQMHRDPLPTRAEKTKKPETKYKLPPEPERRAIILLPQLRMQDSKNPKARDIPSDVSRKLSIKMAAKYMRFEQSVHRESSGMKRQREFYDALLKHINGASRSDFLHPPDEPVYRMTFTDYWVRTRWVLHDLKLPESRQLRCEWFQEHLQWSSAADSSSLDQLSFAAVMAKRELQRRTLLQEPDDLVLHKLSSLIDTKKKLTDAFEWHPAYFPSADNNRQDFDTKSLYKLNRLAYHSFDVLPPDKNRTTGGRRPALYVRIISDRVMSWARKTWNR